MMSGRKGGRGRALSVIEVKYWETAPKRFCQYSVRKFWFWLAVGIFALIEPILCSQVQTTLNLTLQVSVLGISSLLYFIQIVGVATTEWEQIQAVQALGQFGSILVTNKESQLSIVKLFVFFTAEGEFLVEGAMLLAGWILIFWHPGLAILRCFRVFRLLWFYEIKVFKRTTIKWLSPYLGEGFVLRGFKVLKFAIKSLSALGDEIFRLTPETRGGLLLMMVIFYSAFVLGAALFVETQGQGPNCNSFGLCMYTLVRLTLLDGNGLDFAYYLSSDYKILFFIVMLYMCITAFGIINGLVGIFGTLFSVASSKAFEEEDTDGRYGKEEEEEDYSSDEDSEPRAEPKSDTEIFQSLEEGRKDEPGLTEYPVRLSDAQRESASNLMASVEGKAPPMNEGEIKSHLQDALGSKKVSNFVVQEFQNLQAKNSPRYSPRAAGEKPNAMPKIDKDYQTLEQLELKPKPKVAIGMFSGGLSKQKSNLANGNPSNGSGAQLNMTLLSSHMNQMQRKIDQQQDLIENMLNHIMVIQKHFTGNVENGSGLPTPSGLKVSRKPSGVRGGYKQYSVAEITPFSPNLPQTDSLQIDDAELDA